MKMWRRFCKAEVGCASWGHCLPSLVSSSPTPFWRQMCQNKHLRRNRNESTNMIPHAEGLDLAGSIDVRSGFGIVRSHRHICWRTDTLKKPKKSWKPTRFLDIRLTCRDASAVKVLEQQDRLFADVMSYSTSYLHYFVICTCFLSLRRLQDLQPYANRFWSHRHSFAIDTIVIYDHYSESKSQRHGQLCHSNCKRSSSWEGEMFDLDFFLGKDGQWSWPRLLRLSDIFFPWKDTSICETKCRSHSLAKVESWQQISLSKHAFPTKERFMVIKLWYVRCGKIHSAYMIWYY